MCDTNVLLFSIKQGIIEQIGFTIIGEMIRSITTVRRHLSRMKSH